MNGLQTTWSNSGKKEGPKSDASYALAAIQFFPAPGQKSPSLELEACENLEPSGATNEGYPFQCRTGAGSMAGQAFKWKQFRMGWLLILGFAAFLRTSELITIERKEVVLPQHGRPQEAVLLLSDTKGIKKNLLPLDKVVIQEKLCLQALQQLCKGLQPGDSLSQQSNRQFRKLFKDLLHALQLGNQGYMPYSLRRGGVTSAYKLGVPLDVLVTQGRWQHLPTARLYIDHGLQSLAQISHPPQILHLCAKMRQWFRTVSQDGTRGMRLGKCQSWMADTS